MERRKLGSLEVSLVGLGCNNFGIRLDQARTTKVVSAALEAGINFFDTADVYGGTKSEEFLGRALGAQRSSVVVASKFGLPLNDQQPGGGRPEYVKQALEASLRRLGTDYLDLYQYHRPDPTVPIAETLGALNELVRAGKVREIGCSNFSVAQLDEAEQVLAADAARFVSIQNEYSLLARKEEDVLAVARKRGIGFLPYFPLASGLLSGKYGKGGPVPTDTRLSDPNSPLAARFLSAQNVARADALARFAQTRGHGLLTLAFSWLAQNHGVSSIIAGATSSEQVRANVAATAWRLTADELGEIDRIAPRG
jgi:aryl-alcohol dehydrogenase-like predicted oxidoreductase